ncbi:MAG: hypothetical protein LM568_03125 [Desulfurococcaceae archaeon]|nr:hypothetical protein [Desulfurococcaceae archaeon]
MLIRSELRKAGKSYRCNHCGSVINKGDLYIAWYQYDFGRFVGVDRFCLRCGVKDLDLMLRHGVSAIKIYIRGGEEVAVVPIKDSKLPDSYREVIEKRLGILNEVYNEKH